MGDVLKKIPGSDNLFIDRLGNIKGDSKKYKLVKYNQVILELNSKRMKVYLKWLILIAYFEVCVDNGLLLNVKFVPTDFHPTRSKTLQMMVIDPPVEYKAGYRIIPIYTRYAINRSGIILDTVDGSIVNIQKKIKGNYCKCSIYDPEISNKRERYVHRLVGTAWVFNNDYLKTPQLNHIDGDKNNFNANNLEWVSNTENARHAIINNLNKTKRVSVTILNIITNESRTLISLGDASKYMGLSYAITLTKINRSTGPILYKDMFIITHINNVPPVYNKQPLRGSVYQCKHIDGPVFKERSLRKIKKLTGDDPSVVIHDVKFCRDTYSKNGYAYRLYSSLDWKKMRDIKRTTKKILFIDERSGTKTLFNSIRDVAKKLNIDRHVVQRMVRGKDTHINKYKNIKLILI